MPNRLASMLMGGLLWIVAPFAASAADTVPEPQRVRELARAAYVWGYPMVDMYAILRSHVLDPASGEYKAPFNHAGHLRQVGTPADKVVVAPNLDTPYSYAWLDLRAEPVVITVPAFEASRYLSLGFFRTQLLNADDLPQVHRLQDGVVVRPLSVYLAGAGAQAPEPMPARVDAIDVRRELTAPAFFEVLNWMLHFLPVVPEDEQLRRDLATIGIAAGQPFRPAEAIRDGSWKAPPVVPLRD